MQPVRGVISQRCTHLVQLPCSVRRHRPNNTPFGQHDLFSLLAQEIFKIGQTLDLIYISTSGGFNRLQIIRIVD